jgi:hypothetical protein
MSGSLLDRQTSLLEFLTSGAAIFDGPLTGDEGPLRGIDTELRLEARFSHEKRIAAILPTTMTILGADAQAVTRAFVESSPPNHIGRLENSRQFCDFLSRPNGLCPPYLFDLAACELACSQVRAEHRRDGGESCHERLGAIRRNRCAVMLRCSYDVRSVFENASNGGTPRKRNTTLGIAVPLKATDVQVIELAPALFAWLSELDRWTDPASLSATPGGHALLGELVASGLIEARP